MHEESKEIERDEYDDEEIIKQMKPFDLVKNLPKLWDCQPISLNQSFDSNNSEQYQQESIKKL